MTQIGQEELQIAFKNKASVLVDMQYGSTGKGLMAAYLAHLPYNCVDIASTNAGPNAGHTTCYKDGRKFITYHLPTFGVIQSECAIFLNAGSIIDPDMLQAELAQFSIDPKRLFIHPRAVVVEPEDKVYEKQEDSGAAKLASTQKGVGRAQARKVMREATLAETHPMLKEYVRDFNIMEKMSRGARVMVEVPQGFDLSLNDGLSYPYCTSRSINVAQALSDAGIHPSRLGRVVGTQRYYPIRVGNLKGEDGHEIGFSGPCYPDQKEMTWDEAGQLPEFTTVTKRMRRVFTWSEMQYLKGVRSLVPDLVFCNFLNYCKISGGATNWVRSMEAIERTVLERTIPKLFGVGPCVEDVGTQVDSFKKMGWM